jgi:uncharacterized RDD family membrane protein YckC
MASRASSRPGFGDAATHDRQRQLVTPEGVPLTLVVASRGARAGALVLDLMLIGFLQTVTTIALLFMAMGIGIDINKLDGPEGRAIQFLAILWIIAMFLFRNAYFLWFELGPKGATPGKRASGIRVASRDGGRLTTEAVIARNIVRDIELFLPLTFFTGATGGQSTGLAVLSAFAWFGVFVLFPCFNRDRLRCGDLIAGSWVVEAPKRKLEKAMSVGESGSGRSAMTGTEYRFGEAELAVYGEYELQVLERVLRDDRPEALREVAETICHKIGWTSGRGDERAFLEAYYTQLRGRLERGMRFGKRKADKYSGEG